MPDELANVTITNITGLLAAIGGLGTAAYGLVDASKAVAGGMSNPGFGYVREAVAPLLAGPAGDSSVFGRKATLDMLRANWLNGVAKAEQKAAAKSLIRLGLRPASAPHLAAATGVDPARLTSAAGRIRDGQGLTPEDLNVLGEFDVVVSAILDRGYERADQFYRNWAKAAAAIVAVALAVLGGRIGRDAEYWSSSHLLLAVLIGAVATPLAPVVKDLSSSLSAAVKAVGSVRR